jgi:hypothetical protein
MMLALQEPTKGFIVKIIQPPSELQGLSDVLVGSLGLTGVFVLSAVLLALVFAGGLFVFRLKFGDPFPSASGQRPGEDSQGGRITR